jgi:hypothetical protein
MLTLFRFNIREKLMYVVFVSFIMSQVSYFTRLIPEIGFASSYIQYVLSIIVLVVLFRIAIYYSVVMNLTAIAFGIAVQALIILIVWLGLGISLSEVQDNSVVTAAIQILSSTIFMAASRTVSVNNIGFDYVPPSYRNYRVISRKSVITISAIGTVFVASCIIAFLFRHEYEDYLIIEGAIFIVTLPLFLYYSFNENKQL